MKLYLFFIANIISKWMIDPSASVKILKVLQENIGVIGKGEQVLEKRLDQKELT
jgi:hypothetical protein